MESSNPRRTGAPAPIAGALRSIRSLPGRVARRVLTPVRRAIDRALHPRRHRAAANAVRERAPIQDVVFVCFGNICRSPYAEVRLRAELEEAGGADGIRVRSIGFLPPGRPSPEVALDAARRRGLDLSEHRSRSISASELREADLVIVMTGKQRRELEWLHGRPDALQLGDLDPVPDVDRNIQDPYGKPPELFDEVFARIDRAVDALAGLLLERKRSEP